MESKTDLGLLETLKMPKYCIPVASRMLTWTPILFLVLGHLALEIVLFMGIPNLTGAFDNLYKIRGEVERLAFV